MTKNDEEEGTAAPRGAAVPTAIELRTHRGELQAKLYPSAYRLEILRHGTLSVYDLRTGALLSSAEVTRKRRG